MTPEPTPLSGMIPRSPAPWIPLTVIRTTAGLMFAATAIVADDSSIDTGLTAPTLVPGVTDEAGRPRSSDPVTPSARTVPPEARTAASSAAATTDPEPARFWTVAGATGAAAGAGSYQRSGAADAGAA